MLDIPSEDYVALLCEGKSEKVIMSLLLEEKCLCFNEDQLLNNEIITNIRSAKSFSMNYLGFQFDKPIHIIIVQDSKNN